MYASLSIAGLVALNATSTFVVVVCSKPKIPFSFKCNANSARINGSTFSKVFTISLSLTSQPRFFKNSVTILRSLLSVSHLAAINPISDPVVCTNIGFSEIISAVLFILFRISSRLCFRRFFSSSDAFSI